MTLGLAVLQSHVEVSVADTLVDSHQTGTVNLCGCKQTKSRPLCDGTHKSL